MSVVLRVLLILIALTATVFMIRKIRKARLQIEYTVYWIVFAVILLVMALAPDLCSLLARLLGISSPANFVFAVIIFLLLVRVFMMTLEQSRLETKIRELAQALALRESGIGEELPDAPASRKESADGAEAPDHAADGSR